MWYLGSFFRSEKADLFSLQNRHILRRGLVQCAGKGHAEARQLNMPPCFCSDASPWVAPTQALLSAVVSKGFVCKVLPRGILSLCLVITDAVSRRLFTETLSKQAAKVKLLVLRVSHCIEQQQQL